MKKIIDFIHVGDYKTGTTWLQKLVFPFHPNLNFLGDYFTNIKLESVFWELVDARDLDFDATKLRNKFLKNVKYIKGKKIGLSREALSASNYISGENAKRNALRIKEVFGNTKIIYVIREQYSMIETLFNEYVKAGGTQSFKDWFLDPISCRFLLERLQYHKNVEMYYQIFGKKNVLVLTYDQLQTDPKFFLKEIFKFIGCKITEYYPDSAKERLNTKLSSFGIFFARFMNNFFRNYHHNNKANFLPLDKIVRFFIPSSLKKQLLRYSVETVNPSYGKIDEEQRLLYSLNRAFLNRIRKISEKIKIGGSYEININPNYKKQIDKLFICSNRKLRDYYKLNIDSEKWKI